jgi:Fe-Mn family superoxide dismutase
MKHRLPPLPYKTDALEPYLSAETLEYHYGVHHRAYICKLNELVTDDRYTEMSLEEIIAHAPPGPVLNNAAQAWNHAFYWQCMSANGGGMPNETLNRVINQWFGSLDCFRQTFEKACLSLFGSGWVWLVRERDGSLAIRALRNAGNPISNGHQPLLACDLWEHAYYLDHRTQKTRYLHAFWDLINWDFVAANLAHPIHLRQAAAYQHPEPAIAYRRPILPVWQM